MNEDEYELYKTDPDFKRFVDRFRRFKGLGVFEALATKIVKEVGEEYKRQKRDIVK